jgi:hypothetical protein
MIPGEGKPASNFLLARTDNDKQGNVFYTNTLFPLPAEHALTTVRNLPCALRLEYKEQEDTLSVVAFLDYFCPGNQQDTENVKAP